MVPELAELEARDRHLVQRRRLVAADDVPQVIVYNQVDRVPGLEPEIVRNPYGKMLNIKVSAFTGAGIDSLRDALAEIARNDSRDPVATAA